MKNKHFSNNEDESGSLKLQFGKIVDHRAIWEALSCRENSLMRMIIILLQHKNILSIDSSQDNALLQLFIF